MLVGQQCHPSPVAEEGGGAVGAAVEKTEFFRAPQEARSDNPKVVGSNPAPATG